MREDGTLPKAMKLAKLYQEESMKDERAKVVFLGKLIINGMKKGITYDDGRVRPFDVIDFYMSTSFSFDELFYIIRDELNIEDIRMYRKFQQNNDKSEKLILDHLYQSRHILNTKFDEYKRVIPGSGREITLEEKQNLVNFINSNNLPLTKVVYDAAFERWKNDFLELPTKFNEDSNKITR